MLIGGDEVRWLGLIAPHVHLAADADKYRVAQSVQVGEGLIELGIVSPTGEGGAVGALTLEVDVHQEGPLSVLQGGAKDIAPVLQAVGLGDIKIEAHNGLVGHLALVDQPVVAVGQGAALAGAAVVHAAHRLVLGPIVGVVAAGGLGHGVNLRVGAQVFRGGVDGGGAVVSEGLKGRQAQEHGRSQTQAQQGVLFCVPHVTIPPKIVPGPDRARRLKKINSLIYNYTSIRQFPQYAACIVWAEFYAIFLLSI